MASDSEASYAFGVLALILSALGFIFKCFVMYYHDRMGRIQTENAQTTVFGLDLVAFLVLFASFVYAGLQPKLLDRHQKINCFVCAVALFLYFARTCVSLSHFEENISRRKFSIP